MSRLTITEIASAIQRMPGLANVPMGKILDATEQIIKDYGNQPWPWNYAESNVLVPAPYATGTVAITDGTAAVVGTATVWTPYVGLTGWRMRFSNSNLDYIITSINSATSITLAQPVNLGASLTASTYTLYQDTFAYPTDYMASSDVALLQPIVRMRIPKIPRDKFEMAMNSGLRSMATNIQMFYCDQGQLNGRFRFRLGPPPAGVAELRLCYHSVAADVTVMTQITDFPEGYDEAVTLGAAAKLYDVNKQPGMADATRALAAGKLKLLKRQVATATIDDVANPAYEVPDSSISQFGMMISRMS
jgi:hypothetical protein